MQSKNTAACRLYGIHFVTGKADIAPESTNPRFASSPSCLEAQLRDWMIRIENHTDNIGPKAENALLSLHRAIMAVAAYLSGRGITEARQPLGMADAHPDGTERHRGQSRQ